MLNALVGKGLFLMYRVDEPDILASRSHLV